MTEYILHAIGAAITASIVGIMFNGYHGPIAAGLRDLLRIAADGKISDDEIIPYGQALQELNEMVRSAYAVGYAKE